MLYPQNTLLAALALCGGCAGASHATAGATTAPQPEPGSLAQLEQRAADQSERLAELEARLGLLEQEARQWRDQARTKPVETVHIGARRRERSVEEQDEEGSAKTVIRLHEAERTLVPDEPLVLPTPPLGVPTRLAVVALPEDRMQQPAPGDAKAAAQESYRAALRLLKEGRWDESAQALSAFLMAHPTGPLADDAMYWRGESFYAQRRYDSALAEFERVLSRFPATNRAADCMLKVGLCHQRLGDQVSADRFFRKVREQYPSSDAASIASREGAS